MDALPRGGPYHLAMSEDSLTTAPDWERETAAFYDLRARIYRLRKRTTFIPAAAAIVPGILGVALHVNGYWSILGVTPYNTYFVGAVTIMLAFALPAAPIVLLGLALHWLLRRRLLRSWFEEAVVKYALAPAQLEERIRSLL